MTEVTTAIGIICTIVAMVMAVAIRRPISRVVALFFLIIAGNHIWLDFIGANKNEGSFFIYAFFDSATAWFFMVYAKTCSKALYWIIGITAAFTSFAIFETMLWAVYSSTGLGFYLYDIYMAAIAILLLGISTGDGLAWSGFVSGDILRKLSYFRTFDSRADQ